MTTTTVTAPPAATSETAGTSAVTNPNGMLGQNDFLKLMIAQLQAQDPLNPANTNEFVSEIAQFTQVEQTTNLANATELSSAVSLIGRTVDFSAKSGVPGTGVVQSVQSSATGTTLTIGEQSGIALSSITEVQ